MKKMILAALMMILAVYVYAAIESVKIETLKTMGCSVFYDWSQGRFTVSGKSGTANIMLNYPFIVSGLKSYRVDFAPFTEGGVLYISAFTAEKILALTTGTKKEDDTQAVEEKTAVKTVVVEVKKVEIKATEVKPMQVKTVATPVNTRVLTPAATVVTEPVIVEEVKEEVKVNIPVKKSSGRKLIVLDPGHGGNDPGAIGLNGLLEKDVVLYVAQRVKSYLKSDNYDVLITRNSDEFITLKNRAVFANSRNADLFVSIHCNASKNRTASGTRSYIYNRVASSKEAAEAAKFENKDAGAFEFIMNDLRKSAYEYLSIEAAGNVQQTLISGLKLKWLPTERAPFYVLANTNMPSVLVEIAFISNVKEEEKLRTVEFKDRVANGIAQGITKYLDKVN